MFNKLSKLTLISVFLLILVGAVVRSTGAGMGCPDWPKCFGRWVPPTQSSQLPTDYRQRYATHGYKDTEFNPIKTWTEYLNRLLGVTIGGLILVTWVASLGNWKRKKWRLIWSSISVILVGFQGWLGAVVVKTVLHPWVITAHMATALILVCTLMAAQHADHAFEPYQVPHPKWRACLFISWGLTWIQIAIGTQVRQGVDQAIASGVCRCCWLDQIQTWVWVHRGLALVTLIFHVLVILYGIKGGQKNTGFYVWMGCLISEWMMGLVLVYFHMPAWAQPLHLTLASLIFAIQWYYVLETRTKRVSSNNPYGTEDPPHVMV